MSSWQPVKAIDAARCLIEASADDGEAVDLPRLQRLCYYAQGCFLAFHSLPLFNEPIVASADGPQIAAVAKEFALYYDQPIPASEGRDPWSLGVLAGMTLSATHRELPEDGETEYIQTAHDQPLWATVTAGSAIEREDLRLHFVDAFEFGLPQDERIPRDRRPMEYVESDGGLLVHHHGKAETALLQSA